MKIAFFINDLHQLFGKQLVKTMEKYAIERNVELHIFASFGIQDNNLLHAEGEKSILYLPNLEDYGCIMVAGDTMTRYDMHDELMGYLERNAKCPIVGIRYEEDGHYNVLVENYNVIRELTEHFIYKHGFKDICFVTGLMHTKDARERLAGYKEAMQVAGIEVTEHMIFEGDYWRNKGPEIVDFFCNARGGKLPEAIVLSNDYMALSVCDELIRRGHHIPDDICISGFDDLDEAQLYIPPLTSVDVPVDRMAIAALNMAISLANGQEIPRVQWCESKIQYRGTCGCNEHSVEYNKDIYHRQLLEMRDVSKHAVYMQSDFNSAATEEECFAHVQNFLKNSGVATYYVCMKKQDISQDEVDRYFDSYKEKTPKERAEAASKHERMISLRLVVDKDKGVIEEDIMFDKHDILPKKYVGNLKNRASIIAPLHSLNEVYGYFVFQMTDDKDAFISEKIELLCMFFGDTLRRIYMHQNLLAVRDAMHLYLLDPLTNIYNRRGFEQNFIEISDRAKKEGIGIAVISMDMDGLKEINDYYGHKAGDLALCSIAAALSSALRGDEFCARIGGDEFEAVLLLNSTDRIEKFKRDFANGIDEANSVIEENYKVDASMGIFVADQPASMAEYMHNADVLMYENKRKRQKSQKR